VRECVCVRVCVCVWTSFCWQNFCPALQYISTLSHKQHSFREKVIERKVCVLIFYTTFARNIYHCKKNGEVWLKMYVGLCVRYLLFLSYFNESWLFTIVFRNTEISNFMKIHPEGAEFLCGLTDGWTDTTKLDIMLCIPCVFCHAGRLHFHLKN